MQRFFLSRYFFFFCIVMLLVISALFIYRTSYIIADTTYFALMDDLMISMKYAKNFAEGAGLVWNPDGEKVQGITNLLWTLYMSIFHLLPIPLSKTSLFIQISCVVFLAVNLYFVKKLAELLFNRSIFVSSASVFLTLCYIPLLKWGIYGTEVSILTLLTTVCVYLTCLTLKNNRPSLLLFCFLGLGTLIRLDFITIAFVIIGFLILKLNNKNRFFFTGIILFFILIASQLLFNYFYYGYLLPNTYYLKMTGFPLLWRITNGLYVTLTFITDMNWILFFIPVFALLRKNSMTVLLFVGILVQLLYNVYIGGDFGRIEEAGSNRFLSLIMPLFFILFSGGIWNIYTAVTQKYKGSSRWTSVTALFFFIFSIANFNVVFSSNVIENYFSHQKLGSVPANVFNTQKAILIDRITTNDAKVAIVWAGTTPYFSDRTYIDLLGKNDKIIAHGESNLSTFPKDFRKYISYNPGHTKWDYNYSVVQLQPDITDAVGNSKNYTRIRFGKHMYLNILQNSKNIKWDEVKRLQGDKSKLFEDEY